MTSEVREAAGRFVLCSVLEFTDGSMSAMVLHRGPKEQCESVAEKIPAICNSTGKNVSSSYLAIATEEDYQAAIQPIGQEQKQ